ncbi:hypothetical protein [Costertonia aggregata]|uniref:Membrane metalloprotease n=1 Tax=Costertonia aggregata TaxID=343403 RepID=A0A7H9ARY2_9FLAO|nr:hypothetical protein [Costertonia aggregata]QLG46142.1 hypothetical protein HYG79_12545 [Costertonia aggregata]
MKKYTFSLVFFSLILVLGCSKNSSESDDDTPEEPRMVNRTPNLQATGDSANDILSNDNFDKLLIEIAFVQGFRPTQQTIANFTEYLREHTFKEDIELTFKSLPSPNKESLELNEDIGPLETENRTAYNDGTTLAIYIYFADAPSDGDDPDENLVTLGAVYRNTSMIIYESTVRELASRSSIITVTDVETATLNHEFGHLFGLVNIGTTPVNDHESQSENENGVLVGNKHCNVDGCLMEAELQFGGGASAKSLTAKSSSGNILKSDCTLSGESVLKILSSRTGKGNVPDLDAECVLDLQSNGGR